MFVQSKATIHVKEKNGLALRQRRGERETLVQWENGSQRWVDTDDLVGEIRLIDQENDGGYDYV
tara:strand:+ start:132 stop:323 length:192 start_codon:yes stop_codon:yes gene_type:complete